MHKILLLLVQLLLTSSFSVSPPAHGIRGCLSRANTHMLDPAAPVLTDADLRDALRRSLDTNPRKHIAVDMCCGGGGTSFGLISAGYTVAAAFETNPTAADTYELNHPTTKLHRVSVADMRAVRAALAGLGYIDLIAITPPCAPYSSCTAEHHRRTNDPRAQLMVQAIRTALLVGPGAIMIESFKKAWTID